MINEKNLDQLYLASNKLIKYEASKPMHSSNTIVNNRRD